MAGGLISKKRKAAPADTNAQKAKKPAIAQPEKPRSTTKPAGMAVETAPGVQKNILGTRQTAKSSTSGTSTSPRSRQKEAPAKPLVSSVEKSDDDEESNTNVVLEQPDAASKDFEGFGSEGNEDDDDDDDDDNGIVEDDQTAALLQGFESSSDDGNDDVARAEDSNAITTIPTIPTSAALRTRLDGAATTGSTSNPGVVYVGRVPHGFYEHQMRAYFSQFGDISRLRLSRNRRTGASKHYAFLEFSSSEVAQIVADAMDNYLMFGHLLKVKLVPRDKVHAELFKGAGRRFKAVPWNRIEKARLEKVDRAAWEKKVERERRRRSAKAEKLRAAGLEYEPVGLKDVGDVPVQKALEEQADEVKQVEDASEASAAKPQTQDVETASNENPIGETHKKMTANGTAAPEPTEEVTLARSTKKEKKSKA